MVETRKVIILLICQINQVLWFPLLPHEVFVIFMFFSDNNLPSRLALQPCHFITGLPHLMSL